jgi:hypothetical protein
VGFQCSLATLRELSAHLFNFLARLLPVFGWPLFVALPAILANELDSSKDFSVAHANGAAMLTPLLSPVVGRFPFSRHLCFSFTNDL